jgi:phosphatidylglycerophosphate synthase
VPQRGIRDGWRQLRLAQKPAARSAPAYSRFVNRRIGRALAAVCWSLGLSPNAVTAVSAVFTFSAIALLALFPPTWQLGLAVGAGLLIGYAFDSADGQVARLSKTSSPAGEWLDHVVDATKVSSLPLALAIGLYRSGAVPVPWLLVPLGASVVGAVLFFAMILTEQLRKQHSSVPVADGALTRQSSGGWLRALIVLPMDYGVLCLSFLLLGLLPAFLVIYTLITVATAAFLALAILKWFGELRAISSTGSEQQS